MLCPTGVLLKQRVAPVVSSHMGGAVGLCNLKHLLHPCSPLTYMFLTLLAISLYFMFTPGLSTETSWILLVLFAVVALSPGAELEE